MKIFSALVVLVLLMAPGIQAQTTNDLSDKELQGRALVQKMLAQWPAENFTNTGVLKIRGSKKYAELPLKYTMIATTTNWLACYEAQYTTNLSDITKLAVMHDATESNRYELWGDEKGANLGHNLHFHVSLVTNGDRLMIPFAGSDFSLGDLGLEFLHWPQQKVLKREVHSSRGCTVLESTNPAASTNGYSRVMSWIDTETLGIVEAYAYDAKGKQLKIFTPKDFKKVNGQWQVQTFVMENVQTGSRSRLEFDLKK